MEFLNSAFPFNDVSFFKERDWIGLWNEVCNNVFFSCGCSNGQALAILSICCLRCRNFVKKPRIGLPAETDCSLTMSVVVLAFFLLGTLHAEPKKYKSLLVTDFEPSALSVRERGLVDAKVRYRSILTVPFRKSPFFIHWHNSISFKQIPGAWKFLVKYVT